MMPENTNNFNGEDQPLNPEVTGNDDRAQDASNSDAAANNAREGERIQEATHAAAPSDQVDAQSEDRRNQPNSQENDMPATTQGTEEEIEENLSGSTNLSLDQLKKEKDPGGHSLQGE
ncbi:MAG TPA: hypothetical protein VLZ28_01065 [Daejeonella sp.]|nr:hypothetical protein [Daejeonella sp.]